MIEVRWQVPGILTADRSRPSVLDAWIEKTNGSTPVLSPGTPVLTAFPGHGSVVTTVEQERGNIGAQLCTFRWDSCNGGRNLVSKSSKLSHGGGHILWVDVGGVALPQAHR